MLDADDWILSRTEKLTSIYEHPISQPPTHLPTHTHDQQIGDRRRKNQIVEGKQLSTYVHSARFGYGPGYLIGRVI